MGFERVIGGINREGVEVVPVASLSVTDSTSYIRIFEYQELSSQCCGFCQVKRPKREIEHVTNANKLS